jgi:SAM-dependent methyltransferase
VSALWTRQRVLEDFERWQSHEPEHARMLDAEARLYVGYHAARYARLLDAAAAGAAGTGPEEAWHVLDVGPNIQTALLRCAHPHAVVDTLGFAHPAIVPREGERHVSFDLNRSPDPDQWPALPRRYDVIILAEVLEHLYTPAHLVLARLRGLLRPSGFILLQTPNAAALHKRLTLLMGRNPVEAPRVTQENPGHLHEYTLGELRDQVRSAGLTVDWLRAENYFGSGPGAEVYRLAGRLMPATWRHGVTLCARAGE